jgi:hypothetical protein
MTMMEIQNLLTSLMRGIDKKTILTVEQRPDPDRPGVTVQLSRHPRAGSLQLAEVDLVAAQTDLMRRNLLRNALKRTHDRMWQETGYIFSTKMEPHKSEGMSWSRPPQGGRGRR